jgi:hypothetical protein
MARDKVESMISSIKKIFDLKLYVRRNRFSEVPNLARMPRVSRPFLKFK